LRDDDVPAWWQALGLPGLNDIHVHFMPTPLMNAVWRYMDDGRQHYGVDWPVHYRTSPEERLATLERLGVRSFPALLYPHKPDMAESLCEWARGFAAQTPGCWPSGTFYPEPSAARYVREALEAGTRVFKAHVQVGQYDPRAALLTDVWGQLAEAGTPVVVHSGNGPRPGPYTGPGPFGEVLAAHPNLTAVIAHCGSPDYAAHLDLVQRYPNVYVDTTMVGTGWVPDLPDLGADVLKRLGDLQDRVLLGTDFPNIPYPYAQQLAALQGFDLGDDWLRAVCWHNAARLLGPQAPPGST
jgi:hypothetical protein